MASGVVVPYDPAWRDEFEVERDRLRDVLAPWLAADVEHVGSTAIPGMAAKPVIDMIAPVADLDGARDAFEALTAVDYQYRPHRPEAHLFDKPRHAGWEAHTHHLHLTEPGTALWLERLAFRDALREDPALVAEYNAWKVRHAATATGEESAYRETKWPFIARVLQTKGLYLGTDAQRLVQPGG
jgi:GrpB-like predicted nucleotidyltransferase (UPF0157 family)